ncbi:MAG TPA: EscU/YscU/HrcU family type III secretion system export apparatus switch protein [Bryobacteraceae bacterium]|nr:EscU/YscU/HrcU family type III secretion system export apparatus switch protein [Bryobacteraceae bacterium]
MADSGQKTEKPTKQRQEKARKEGQFPVSREMVSAVHFLAFVWILLAWSQQFLASTRELTRRLLKAAFYVQIDSRSVLGLYYAVLSNALIPLLIGGAVLTGLFLAAQLASTKFGVSAHKLTPDWKRLNPVSRVGSVFSQNVSSLFQALLLLPVLGIAVYAIARSSLPELLRLSRSAVVPGTAVMAHAIAQLLWRSAWVLFGIGVLDYVRQYRRHNANLRMSKQEIREELKQTDGNPEIKNRVRRIQRDFARRNMMKEIPKATAVVVNPTHYAVAIRYDMESMAAPRVVAKGKNYLAHRIRQIATQNNVPIVENQPLAQALYKSADVGQEIPVHLYRAVAEVLAYIYRLMHARRR